MKSNKEKFNKIVNGSIGMLLKLVVDTYNRVKYILLSYQSEDGACNEYKRKVVK